jgi:hypothetical protein
LEGLPLTTLNVAGRILTPGTVTLMVNGKPATVHFSRDVILRAYERLKTRVAAGEAGMRLSHPAVGDLPIRYGHVREVRADHARGEVWLAASEPLPELLKLLTPEAAEKLQSLGLSFYGSAPLRRRDDGTYDAVDLDVTDVDIVGKGSFPGSGIVPTIPQGLAAQAVPAPQWSEHGAFAVLAAQFTLNPTGTNKTKESNTMEPEQLKAQLAAKDTELAKAKEEVASLAAKVAELAPKAAQADKATQENATLAAKLTELTGQVKTLESEATDRRAKDDVQQYVLAGKAAPAEVQELVEVRKVTGPDKFRAMMDKRPVIIAPGERGHAPSPKNEAPSLEEQAAKEIAEFPGGPRGVIHAGLHKLATPEGRAYASVLAAKHADDPTVQRDPHIRAVLAAQAPKGGA